uniref:Uncharacterized protein n=1 Tax=Panagrolaimus sp. JU765 TaxID=591449 RepID=A0AC34QDQ3_9BILA
MQSYDSTQSSDSLFQNQGQQSRTTLPPASSLFESTHQNRSFQSDLALSEPSSSFPSYNQPTATYDSQPYFSNQNIPSTGYNHGYPSVYGEPSSMDYNSQMELYPQMPPQQIPMMQPPLPPEYAQQMIPESPMMYPPGPSVGYPQMEQNQWPQQTEYIQNQPYGQMQPMMPEVPTDPLPMDPNMNQPVETQFLPSISSHFGQPMTENSYVQSYPNSTTENYQQPPYNVGYMPPNTALVDYGHGQQVQLQYPQPQPNFAANYPEQQNVPAQTVAAPVPAKKSSEASIADTVAEVIAKQTAMLCEEERAQASKPPPQPKKRRYVATLDTPYPDDGPTVRQILKQQQLEKKRQEQQELLKQQILEDEERRRAKMKKAELPAQNTVPDAVETVQTETANVSVTDDAKEDKVAVNESSEVPFQPSQEPMETSVERSVSGTPATYHGDQIDTDVAAKIQEIGGFDGSTVGELAESIEFPAGVPTTTKRKKTRTRKPRKRVPKVDLIQKENNEKYFFKALHLQNTVRSLVLKNTALADEVSRLLYRIETAAEERKILAKRLQHYERNRIRRIINQKKKRQVLETQQIQQTEANNEKTDSSNIEVPAFAFNDFQQAEMAVVMPLLSDLDNLPVLTLDEMVEVEETKVPEEPVVKKRPRGRPYKRPPPQPAHSDAKATTTTKRPGRKRKVQAQPLEPAMEAPPTAVQDDSDILWGNQDLLEFEESGFGNELGSFQDDFHSFSTGPTTTNFPNN